MAGVASELSALSWNFHFRFTLCQLRLSRLLADTVVTLAKQRSCAHTGRSQVVASSPTRARMVIWR